MIEASYPILVIPPQCVINKEGNALFAIDIENIPNDKSLAALNRTLNLLNHSLDLLFINVNGDEDEIFKIRDNIEKHCESLKIEVYFESEEEVADAIENFISNHNSKMLVLHPGHHTFFDKLMGKSITKNLLSHSHIPVLGIP